MEKEIPIFQTVKREPVISIGHRAVSAPPLVIKSSRRPQVCDAQGGSMRGPVPEIGDNGFGSGECERWLERSQNRRVAYLARMGSRPFYDTPSRITPGRRRQTLTKTQHLVLSRLTGARD